MLMLLVLLVSGLAVLIPFVIFLLAWILSCRGEMDREKISPFECGFDPMGSARLPFSLRFFLLAVIFLVFDVEIILLFPIIISLGKGKLMSVLFGGVSFLLILLIGLIHEWREGSLDWIE
nr:NADH dehydrogenase subunit 3 [Acharax sp. NY-2022]